MNIGPAAVNNLFANLSVPGPDESFTTLLARPGLRIERIVSHGYTTPPDQPYEQSEEEWVLLIQGAACLWLDGRGEVALAPGDYLLIPAGLRHRVTWTAPDRPTVWLAIHFAPEAPVSPAPTDPPDP